MTHTTFTTTTHKIIGVVLALVLLGALCPAPTQARDKMTIAREAQETGEMANYWLHQPTSARFVAPMPYNQVATPLSSYMRISRDRPILQALTMLANSEYNPVVTHIQQRGARVIFKDMKTLGKALKNYDAVSWISPPQGNGQSQWMIFVNYKHQDAPIEALASIIAHEALHFDGENSLAEEVAGWQQEGTVWATFTENSPALREIDAPIIQRLETIRKAIAGNTLQQLVASNPGYATLQPHSHGFGL